MQAGFCVLALAAGCQTQANRTDAVATGLGYERQVVQGGLFEHVLYFKPGQRNPTLLHVYIDHDGVPWGRADQPSSDPTPRDPSMLRWMARDPASALYLGRPCYHGLAHDETCSTAWWTDARFGREVVDSLARALDGFMRAHPGFGSVVLIGYSGGGVLAVLLADQLDNVQHVVTIAAPLDTDAWTALHAFDPLVRSINPAVYPFHKDDIQEVHWTGGRDRNVPPTLAQSYVQRRPHARLVNEATFDHVCCWGDAWSRIVAEPDAGPPSSLALDTPGAWELLRHPEAPGARQSVVATMP
jgi:pimeloyl-ACP methyl ester carboxylesterase